MNDLDIKYLTRQEVYHFMLWFNNIDLQSRTQTKRTLGEETFQREIMGGLINGITLCQNIKVMTKIIFMEKCATAKTNRATRVLP